MSGNCMDCRYSQVDTAEDDGMPVMRCHRFPPQLAGLDGEVVQSWPNVGPADWCGEYMPAGPRQGLTPVLTRVR